MISPYRFMKPWEEIMKPTEGVMKRSEEIMEPEQQFMKPRGRFMLLRNPALSRTGVQGWVSGPSSCVSARVVLRAVEC